MKAFNPPNTLKMNTSSFILKSGYIFQTKLDLLLKKE